MNAQKLLGETQNGRMSPTLAPTQPPSRTGFGTVTACTDDVALVGLQGELDVAARGHLDAVVRALLDSGGRELLLDLTELTFMDCAGLRALLGAARAAEMVGARCYVFRAQGQPRELMAWARGVCLVGI